MFRITPNPTFTFEVLLSRPDSDKPVPIDITCRHKTTAELADWLNKTAESDLDMLAEVIVGWGRVLNTDDQPLPFSREALALLLSTFPSASVELYQAYRKRLADARAKN